MPFKPFVHFVSLILLVSGNARAARPLPNLWDNPTFQKHLLGSFGINSEIEPAFKDDNEAADYEQIMKLVSEKPEEALKYLQQLAAVQGSSARIEFIMGNIYFQKGRGTEAEAFFKKAIEKFANYRQAHNNLAILYVQAGKHAEAATHFTEAIRLGSSDGTTFGLLGVSYLGLENFLAAEGAFRNAMLLRPDVKDWEMGLIQALFRQEKWPEIISLMNRMIEAKPDDANLWEVQAGAYLGQKNVLAAAGNFEMLDRMGKLKPEQLATLSDIYINEGLFDLAADAYLRSFEKAGASSGVERPLRAAEILLSREGYKAARTLVQKVQGSAGAALDAGDKRKLLKLEAKIGMADGKEDDAAKKLQEVVDLDPLDGDALIVLGQYFQRKNENEKAVSKYEQAASVSEHEQTAKVRHAQLLVGMGKYDQAIPLLKRAQEIKPTESVGKFLEDLERFMKSRR